MRIGMVLFALGLLLVAFVAYQLWGTALYEAQAQSHLKSELAHQLHTTIPASAPKPVVVTTTTSTTTHASTPSPARTSTRALTRTRSGRGTRCSPARRRLPSPSRGRGCCRSVVDPTDRTLSTPSCEGVGEAQLEQGPGHYPGTALPGESGNVAIAGHRTTYAHPFYNLDALSPGDDIYILTAQGLFHYTVTGTQIVAPTDVNVLDTVPGKSTLTLTTCNPRYSAAQRLVVTAAFDGTAGAAAHHHDETPKGSRSWPANRPRRSAGTVPRGPPVLWGLLTLALRSGRTSCGVCRGCGRCGSWSSSSPSRSSCCRCSCASSM